MKSRVTLELLGSDGPVVVHEIGGRAAAAEFVPRMIGFCQLSRHSSRNEQVSSSLEAAT
jgi:hypothetical protein